MFKRLKGGASQAVPKNLEPAPTKEDILSSLEQFGENAVRSSKESNNNTKRRDIHDRENVDPADRHWDMVEEINEKSSTPTSGQHSYSVEWERHFQRPHYLRWLRQQAISGELRPCRFRSICWRLFLEVLPEDMSAWSDKAHQDRMKYETLKCKLITNPRRAVDSVNVMINNPLSQDEESPWNKFFQDNELRLTIKQDVIRTYPKIEFFQSNQMRNVMVDILFIFAKENPDVSYQQIQLSLKPCSVYCEILFFRDTQMQDALTDVLFYYCREHENISYKQGMHELLAPIIFVLHYDHQAFLHASETDNVLTHTVGKPLIKDMLDPRYLEHDAYYMFCQVMATVEPWYLAKDVCSAPKKKHDVFTSQPFARSQELIPSSVIVTKLTRIQDYLLKKFDLELHAHLETLEIAPQIYGIRWLRLLFGREFPMQDLLMLWDAIFADGIGFDLVDYIFVAMMLYIRDLLLASDYAGCLTALMKFPQVSDAHYFIDKSLWLREPSQYPRPPNYSHQVTSRSHHSAAKSKQAPHAQKYRGGFSSFSRKFSRPKTLSVSTFEKNLPKSSSEPMNLQTDISPVSPHQNKRGSTASLSQVEDSMFRQRGQSSSSLGRTDHAYLRSAQSSPAGYSPVGFSPEEPSAHSSPTKYSTLPSRGKQKGRKLTKQEQELQQQVSTLQGQLNENGAMCRYCASKLDVHIGRLQEELSKQKLDTEDEVMVSLAGIKLVRDVLNGTLRFSRNILDEDGEINISDNHYQPVASPDCDMVDTPGSVTTNGTKRSIPSSQSKERRRRMFYMSSGETSSAAESPESFNGTGSAGLPSHLSDSASNTEYELGDLPKRRSTSIGGKGGHSAGHTEERDSTADTSSQASSYAASGMMGSDNFEDSPNPLYTEWVSDFA